MQNISWRHFDFWLLGAVALLTLFGIVMIRSAIAGNIELVEANTVQKQVIFAVAGFIVIGIMSVVDYKLLAALSNPLYFGTIFVLAALNLVGGALFGSARWFVLGPILIQPSEIAKIIMIIVLADFFPRNQHKLADFRWVIRSLLVTIGLAKGYE